VGGIPKKFDVLAPNGCCTNGFEVGGNCEGNGWEENIFVCCCCTGNFGVIPVDVWGVWWVDENGALPNIELFKPDTDVRWPPLAVFPKIEGWWSCIVFCELNSSERAAYLSAGSGGGWAKLFAGIDIVFVSGVFVRIVVGCFVVSTNAPQLVSLDDDDVVVVCVNGWSEKKFFVGDVFVVFVVAGGEDCKISKSDVDDVVFAVVVTGASNTSIGGWDDVTDGIRFVRAVFVGTFDDVSDGDLIELVILCECGRVDDDFVW